MSRCSASSPMAGVDGPRSDRIPPLSSPFGLVVWFHDDGKDSESNNEKERRYGSMMMERLTGSPDGRIDHVLQLCGELQESTPVTAAAQAASATPASSSGATLVAEPRGAEYIAALAAGNQARHLADVGATGASSSPAPATTVALAVAAARTGGRLVCVRRDPRGLARVRRHLERLGLATGSVAFQLGRPAEAVRRLGRVDFAVVHGDVEDREEVLEALDVDPTGAIVVITDAFQGQEGRCPGRARTSGHGSYGQVVGRGKSMVLPIGSGMEVIKIGRVEGPSGAHNQRPVKCSSNGKRTFLVCE
ncbi:hypothetical protein ACP70R_003612 [Stipagrostis hirtigluma subsp. patula]